MALTAKQQAFRKFTPEEALEYKKTLAKLYKPTGRVRMK